MDDRPQKATIRDEDVADHVAVGSLIASAFAAMPFSSGTEAQIAAALRRCGAAVVSLVAEQDGEIVGQAMFSPVEIDGKPSAWHALGPIAVAPARQKQGVGTHLIHAGFGRLKAMGSQGCVLEGAAGYYGRFGFRPAPSVAPPGPGAPYFMILPFGEALPEGTVTFHPAFFDQAAGGG